MRAMHPMRTLRSARRNRRPNRGAITLANLQRYAEAKALLLKTIPVALRVLGEGHDHTLRMRSVYAETLYIDPGATLADLREAVTTLEETERMARRVFGGAHPITGGIEAALRDARAVLRAREAPPGES